ncbi:MAG: hypothetical protein QOG34_341 [Frankiaceae bacterium]|nr:hypothetical protein [Frankiaceae bacterium]
MVARAGLPDRVRDHVKSRDVSGLAPWWLTRVAVAVAALAGLWMVQAHRSVTGYLHAWDQWDARLLREVAQFGYRGYRTHTGDTHLEAFFPGQPAVVRAVHFVVPSWIAAGLLVSLIAGAFACVALSRLADLEGAGTGRLAVIALVLSPYAVFLAAGYSEALFLAFALPCWLAARRGRWLAAGGLGALAATVRITGVFLGAALIVQWLVDNRGRGRARDGLALLGPWAVTAGYFGYLHTVTGDWLAWTHAERDGWGRQLTAPWTAFRTTWHAAFAAQPSDYAWSFRAEILAVLIGVVLTVTLIWMRRWGESVYVGGQVVALATSAYYLSVARATLLWWPLWVLLARAAQRWRPVGLAYLAAAPALMIVAVVAFTQGHWVG